MAAIEQHADRIGVDVVVFGSIQQRKNAHRDFGERLQVSLRAHNFMQPQGVSETVNIDSHERANLEAYALFDQRSLWQPAGASRVDEPTHTFDQELEAAVEIVANRVLDQIDLEAWAKRTKGGVAATIYVPPADSQEFVRQIQAVRNDQLQFWSIYEERQRATLEGDPNRKGLSEDIPWKGEMRSIEDVEGELLARWDALGTAGAGEFGRTLSQLFIEFIRNRVAPNTVIKDAGFVPKDALFVDASIADGTLQRQLSQSPTGGLARTWNARQKLLQSDIDIVFNPKIVRFGEHFSIRVEMYELNKGSVEHPASARINRHFSKDLAKALEIPLEEIWP